MVSMYSGICVGRFYTEAVKNTRHIVYSDLELHVDVMYICSLQIPLASEYLLVTCYMRVTPG